MMSLRVASVTGSKIALNRAVLSKPGSNTLKKKIAGCRSVSNEPGPNHANHNDPGLFPTHPFGAVLGTYLFIMFFDDFPFSSRENISTTKGEMQWTERTQVTKKTQGSERTQMTKKTQGTERTQVTKKTQGTEWTAENQQKDGMFETLDITIP